MSVTTSEVFEFLSKQPAFAVDRHEISSNAFGNLRRCLRFIVVKLHEDGDREGDETADRLRSLLSEWLTTPLPFDAAILSLLKTSGNSDEIEARWGADIRDAFDSALSSAQDIQLVENPVRSKLRNAIRELRASGKTFKIYCHPKARAHFESLFTLNGDMPLHPENFLHSVRDYRESSIFDSLIKVGPFRSWGWGSAPDAIKSAPRFSTIIQIVWVGCNDEPGFGYDPVAPSSEAMAFSTEEAPGGEGLVSRISWTPHVTRFGDSSDSTTNHPTDEDEFQIFGKLNQSGIKRRAILIQIGSEHGILYPPHSQVLSFDPSPDARVPIAMRRPDYALTKGMFVIRPLLESVDLGGQLAEHGSYSRLWKARLNDERQSNSESLVRRLRAAGLPLLCLPADIRNWCVAPTTVIHAPHKRKHFEILIQVLGVGFGESGNPRKPWWHHAWDEIRLSRGEAIQAGRQEQEIVDEQLSGILGNLLTEIRQKAAISDGFSLKIPARQTLAGIVQFNQVSRIEEGFLAPDTELKVARDLNTIEQWRA